MISSGKTGLSTKEWYGLAMVMAVKAATVFSIVMVPQVPTSSVAAGLVRERVEAGRLDIGIPVSLFQFTDLEA